MKLPEHIVISDPETIHTSVTIGRPQTATVNIAAVRLEENILDSSGTGRKLANDHVTACIELTELRLEIESVVEGIMQNVTKIFKAIHT